MINLNIHKIIKCDYFIDNCSFLSGLTFDGECFYITDIHHKSIFVLDECLNFIKEIKCTKCYNSISYDYYENCFWGINCNDNKIYKLDKSFIKIKEFQMDELVLKYGDLRGICCSGKDKILICFTNVIIESNKNFNYHIIKINKCKDEYTSIIDCSKCILCSSHISHQNYLNQYDSDFNSQAKLLIPNNFLIMDSTYFYNKHNNECIILILANNNKIPYLFYCILKEIQITNNSCDKFNDFCKSDEICSCHNLCNSFDDSNIDIVKSVALIEASLAHILNAEGEKIQKAVKCSNDISELLKVNDSVNKTITNIIHLEQILLEKLECATNECNNIT